MARKTHPVSYRLGITAWWPSRTALASANPRSQNRYSKVSSLLKGILNKFGYRVTSPQITTTISTEEGRLAMVISKKENRQKVELDNTVEEVLSRGEAPRKDPSEGLCPSEVVVDKKTMTAEDRLWDMSPKGLSKPRVDHFIVVGGSPPNQARESVLKHPVEMYETEQASTYVMSYIATLVAAYENRKYVLDLREIQDVWTQGTAGIIADSIVKSDRDLVPTMAEIERRVRKGQARIEQRQAFIQAENLRSV